MRILPMLLALVLSCAPTPDVESSPVKRVQAEIKTDPNGLTVEQKNVKERLEEDNRPGSVKHLYVVSAYTGDVIFYSTVSGKVTSSGKRLTPLTVAAQDGQYVDSGLQGIQVHVQGRTRSTSEVLQDDGTYGSSIDYLFWWDTRGAYHQHYPSGGQIIHVSDQPITARKPVLQVEAVK